MGREVGVAAGDADVRGESESQAASDRRAVDCGNHRLSQLMDLQHELGEMVLRSLDEADRAAALGVGRIAAAPRHVRPCAEAAPIGRAAQDYDPGLPLVGNRREHALQRAHHVGRQRVVAGAIDQLDHADAGLGREDPDELFAVHHCCPFARRISSTRVPSGSARKMICTASGSC